MVGHRRNSRSLYGPPSVKPVSPTPETLAKLRRDVVARLHAEGRLTDEERRASDEIRRVWEAVGRGLFARAHSWDQARQPHQQGMFRDPLERMTETEEIMWRNRYRPWAREMSIDVVTGIVRVSRLQIVLDIAVDNYGLRQVEAWYRMRHGIAIEHLRAALHRYAELAGWVSASKGSRKS